MPLFNNIETVNLSPSIVISGILSPFDSPLGIFINDILALLFTLNGIIKAFTVLLGCHFNIDLAIDITGTIMCFY